MTDDEKNIYREDRLIAGFRDVYNKLIFLNKFKMEEALKGFKSSEVHCIEYIGRNSEANVTKLAESFYMTKGAISKITKKLIERNIIQSYQKPENKKEIYFKLTKQGQAIYDIHEGLHREFHNRDKIVFDQVNDIQLEIMLDFVENYIRHLDEQIREQDIDGINHKAFD